MRTLCFSRPFGVKSDSITMFPDITDFEIIMLQNQNTDLTLSLLTGWNNVKKVLLL